MKWGATLFVLFAFAAGGAFGYLVGDGSSSTDLGLAGDGAEPAPRSRSDGVSPSPGPSPAPGVQNDSVSFDASAFPDRELPTGDGRITGVVRDEAGQGLSDVLVRATWRFRGGRGTYRRGEGPPEEKGLEESVREFVENYRWQRACRREAKTDASGHYELEGIGDGAWYLSAWVEGYEVRMASNRGEVHAGEEVDFVAKALATIPVVVLLPDGTRPEAASIETAMGYQRGTQGWSADRPYLRVDPGVWKLRATGGEENEFRSKEVEVVVEKAARVEPVTLQLADLPGIRGRVIFAGAGENSSGFVTALPAKDGAEPDFQTIMRSPNRAYFHNGGSYVFRDLAPGSWRVTAAMHDGTILASATVEVADRMVEQDLTVPEPEPNEYVVVSVEAPDGTPVTDASCSSRMSYSQGRHAQSQRYQRLPDGTYRVFNPKPRTDTDVSDATYAIQVSSARFGQKSVDYVPRAGARISCRFEEPAWVEIEVAGADSSGLGTQLQVYLRPPSDANRPSVPFVVSPGYRSVTDGKVSFGPIAPGEYDALLMLRDSGGASTIATSRLHVAAGRGHETITMPALYPLTVVVPTDGKHVRATLSLRNARPGESFYRNARPSEDGKVVFENVPAGDYQLWVYSSEGNERMELTVPSSSVVEFRPMTTNAYLVHVTSAEGALARAGFREGDLLVGIDDRTFENARQMNALITLARSQKSSVFHVQRGNRVVDLTVEDAGSLFGRESGGRFEQASR